MRYPDQTDRVLETLSYFDTMNMADRIRCPIFASVALGDQVCPAKCYYASYNRITAPKEITVYPFNGHDGAGDAHMERELGYLRESGFLARGKRVRPGRIHVRHVMAEISRKGYSK